MLNNQVGNGELPSVNDQVLWGNTELLLWKASL